MTNRLRDYLPKTLYKYIKYKVLFAKLFRLPCYDFTMYQKDGLTIEIVVVRLLELLYNVINT